MRFSKLFAPVLTVAGLFLGTGALADGPPPLQQFADFYQVGGYLPGMPITVCVVATPAEAGLPASIKADGVTVGSGILAPGPNLFIVPDTNAVALMATAPGVMAASLSTFPGNPGVN